MHEALLQAMQQAKQLGFEGRTKLLAPAVERAFALPQILQTSVGSKWAALPAAQQAELLDVFTRYTVASYAANFDGFSGERFEIKADTRAVGADQVVQTRIVLTHGDPVRIDYQMREVDGGWRAVDVLIDGSISRVAVQRSDFRSLLAGGDAGKLIESLRAKTAALAAGGKP
jgi:phospholipid transport system substrate-binding protein